MKPLQEQKDPSRSAKGGGGPCPVPGWISRPETAAPEQTSARIRRRWLRAKPFPHVVIDSVFPSVTVDLLRRGFLSERFSRQRDDVLSFLGSSAPPTSPVLRSFLALLDSPVFLAFVSAVVGIRVVSAETKAYIYLDGDYLLPHVDAAADSRRAAAYVYYLDGTAPTTGGGLELFRSRRDPQGRLFRDGRSVVLRPVPNRLVLFDSSISSLHQVREVLSGTRLSLTGWFHL